MHDIDHTLRSILETAELAIPPGDRRSSIAARAGRRRRRQHVALAVPIATGAMVLAVAVAASSGGGTGSDVAGRTSSDVRVVDVPGVPDEIRMSTTNQPVPEGRSFGSIPLAGGAITGATQTVLDDGTVVVLVAVTPGPSTSGIAIVVEGSRQPIRAGADGEALLLTVPLTAWEPQVVVEVQALDDESRIVAASRVAPFAQSSLTCETNTETVGDPEASAGPTRMAHLDAFLAAPLPASCRG